MNSKLTFSVIITSILLLILSPLQLLSSTGSNNKTTNDLELTSLEKPLVATKNNPYVTINLSANKTTGFTWYLKDYPSCLITPVENKYITKSNEDTKTVGQGGIISWKLKLKNDAFTIPQIIKITLSLARPWDIQQNSDKEVYIYTQTS